MTLYHGSSVPGIAALTPRQSSHDKPYIYLTHSPALATLYAHNPLPRPYGWYTYYWQNDQLHYEEYFPHQTESFYHGQTGYIYTCEANLPTLDKMPWVYMSETDISPVSCRIIPDLYQELLTLESAGQLIIHRYHTLSENVLRINERIVQHEIDRHHLKDAPGSPYAQFIHLHFPALL